MSSYQIDYSDPLQTSFSIPAGGLNGPGASAANSTLRLYGRGALEWGEAVDENQLRLTENFSSATAPSSAIPGQLWVETKYYYHQGSNLSSGWFRWNVAGQLWDSLNGTGNVATIQPSIPSIGQYWYGQDNDENGLPVTGLWGYYSLGRYEPAKWCLRAYSSGTASPFGTIPKQKIKMRKVEGGAFNGWNDLNTTIVTDTDPNNSGYYNITIGQLWYSSLTGTLKVFTAYTGADATHWQDVVGPSNGTVASTASFNINMNNNIVTGLRAPTTGSDATNKAYVDAAVGGSAGSFLPITGGTVTGNLTVTGTTTLNALSVTGTIGMGGQRVTNIGAPTAPADATTKQYVDAAVSGGSGTGVFLPLSGGTVTGNLGVNGSTTLGGTLNVNATTNAAGSIILSGGSSQVTLPNAPTSPNHAANKAYVDAAITANAGSPSGTVVMFAGQTVPSGWVACEGQTLNTTTFAALFAAIGYAYGGSGASFNAPDLRGQFVRGWSNGGAVDPGRTFGSTQTSQVEKHKHMSIGERFTDQPGYPFGGSPTQAFGGIGKWDTDNALAYTNDGTAYAPAGVVDGGANWNRVGLIGTETRPTNVAMRYIIKT